MMRLGHAAVGFLVTCILAAPLGAQVGNPKLVSKDVAKAAVKEFSSEYKSKDKKLRMAALDRLTPYRHELIARCLERALKDREPDVRAAAAARLGGQDAKPSLKALNKALGDKKNRGSPKVIVAIFESFRAHKKSPPLKTMKKLFSTGTKEVQREVVRTLRFCRNEDSIKFLAQLVDMPQPGNVDSPTNPPASYWKDKVSRWNFWFNDVSQSLVHLTGTEFDSSKDARDWLRSSAKILSIEQGEKAVKDL